VLIRRGFVVRHRLDDPLFALRHVRDRASPFASVVHVSEGAVSSLTILMEPRLQKLTLSGGTKSFSAAVNESEERLFR